MAMQVNGNSGANYTEKVREKQAAEREKETIKTTKAAEKLGAAKLSEPRDEYISSEKSGKKSTGLYHVGQDESGNRKIFYDDPKAAYTDKKEGVKTEEDGSRKDEDNKEPKVGENQQGQPAEKCVTNTDKVDREIKKLKEKKQNLEQQIQSTSGDEKKIRELEKKLAQIKNELSQKDNDTYRRQNAFVSE